MNKFGLKILKCLALYNYTKELGKKFTSFKFILFEQLAIL